MKKVALFIAAALIALFVLSKLPNAAQARSFNMGTPPSGTVISAQ